MLVQQAQMTAAHALLEMLEREGVEYIFGVPGGPLTALFEALRERNTIKFILAKHEEGAAFMAASHSKVRGGLSVCCVTSGPGATNSLTGIASAYADSLPVLVLTGQVATRVFGMGAIQESTAPFIDVVQIFRPVTKLSMMVPSGDRVAQLVGEAIRQALSARRGPVHLSMPADVLKQPSSCAAPCRGRFHAGGAPVDEAAAVAAARRLMAAERPLVLAGHGAAQSGAHAELLQLAERLAIPVATTPKGKGVFPESHRLSLGLVGLGGHPRADTYLAEGIDVLLVLGSSLGEFATDSWDLRLRPRRALLQVDTDEAVMGRNYPVDVGVVGDIRAALARMLRELPAEAPRRDPDPLRSLRERVPRFEAADLLRSDRTPLAPQRLMHELRAALPDDGLLFVDAGNAILWGGHYFEARRPGTYFIDLGLACMGSAVAGAVGGKLAAPDRPVVALVGDGAFAMNGMEVHTAVEHGIAVTWVVLNNQGLGMVAQGERLLRGCDLGYAHYRNRFDIAGMAAALGADAFRVESAGDLRRALGIALASRRPAVIDALIDESVVPPTLRRRAQSLARFYGAAPAPRAEPAPRDGGRP